VETSNVLKRKIADFTAKCLRQGGLKSCASRPGKQRRGKRGSSSTGSSTASLSDGPVDTPARSMPSSSSLLSDDVPFTIIAASQNVTVRASTLLKWRKLDNKSADASPSPAQPRGRSHRLPSNASASTGVAFVPYRSPACFAGATTSNLHGSGAISSADVRFW